MTFRWLKRYAPRSLYARAALILLLPVITIQLVVSVVFIQRLYEDVAQQMTDGVALEFQRLIDLVETAPDFDEAMRRAVPFAASLAIEFDLPSPPITEDDRLFYDLSGRLVISTLRKRMDWISGIDLRTDDKKLIMTRSTNKGMMRLALDRDRVSASNPHQLLVVMILTSFLMTVIAYLFLKNQLRPIRRLAKAAKAFGKGQIVPYRPQGATEVRAAGAAFVDMRHRIERQIEQRTLMLSGVSHDLRTPLTRLKLGLSMMDDTDPDVAALLGDVDEMRQMMDAFLDFSRDGALDDPSPTDPSVLLHDVAENARRGGQDVRVGAVDGSGIVVLRPLAITRALENLVGNAVRHGSVAHLSLQIKDRSVVYIVEDDGPGISAERRVEAMRPFSRLDAARNQNKGAGVGLGLSIAIDIARQHGGTLRLDQSSTLGGLRADLVLAR